MWRAVPGTQEREPVHTGWCLIQPHEFPGCIEIGPRQNWFSSRFMRQCSLWCSSDSRGQISFIAFWLFDCVTGFYLNCHFGTGFFEICCRYQTRERTISKYQLLIPLTKFQIHISKYHLPTLQKWFSRSEVFQGHNWVILSASSTHSNTHVRTGAVVSESPNLGSMCCDDMRAIGLILSATRLLFKSSYRIITEETS